MAEQESSEGGGPEGKATATLSSLRLEDGISDRSEQQGETTARAPPLPHVVWRCIASHLSASLGTLLHLASFSADLVGICRPYISAFFETLGDDWITRSAPPKDLPTALYYHRVVQLILEGDVDASAIRVFRSVADYKCFKTTKRLRAEPPQHSPKVPASMVKEMEHAWKKDLFWRERDLIDVIEASSSIPTDTKEEVRVRFLDGDSDAALAIVLPLGTEQERTRSRRLLRDAVNHALLFVQEETKEQICVRFVSGDPDAALAILLPLCTELKVLDIPADNTPLCAAVVKEITRAYDRRGVTATEARQKAWEAALRDRAPGSRHFRPAADALPFSELLVLYAHYDFDEGSTFHLSRAIPYLGIPPSNASL